MDIFEKLESALPNDVFLVTDIDADIDIAGPKYYKIVAPQNKDLHLVMKLMTLTAAKVEIYKSPTIDAAGTALAKNPLNGNASFTPDTVITYDATVSGEGTLFHIDKSQALLPLETPKFVLQRAKTYTVKITSIADNNNSSIFFYGKEVA